MYANTMKTIIINKYYIYISYIKQIKIYKIITFSGYTIKWIIKTTGCAKSVVYYKHNTDMCFYNS